MNLFVLTAFSACFGLTFLDFLEIFGAVFTIASFLAGVIAAIQEQNIPRIKEFKNTMILMGVIGLIFTLILNFSNLSPDSEPNPKHEDDVPSDTSSFDDSPAVKNLFDLDNVSVGEHFYFGTYEQDNNYDNGKEPIEWRVLDKESDRALLLSEKLLDYQLYHSDYVRITWEECTLRQWLNGTFYQNAFTSAERERINQVKLSNPDSSRGVKGGNSTWDYIFVLSVDDIHKYFKSTQSMIAYTTDYTHTFGFDDVDRSGRWWLRNPGLKNGLALRVYGIGGINSYGNRVNDETVAVRPAMWVNF